MSLELSNKSLVVQVPHRDVTVRATAEAHFGVGADGQSVAGGCTGRQLCFDPGSGARQVPNGEVAGLTTNDQGSAIWQQFNRSDVVIPLLKFRNNY